MGEEQPVRFNERMFSHAARDRIAVLAVPRSGGKAEQHLFTLPQATARKVQAWLRHPNARDYDIYLCVNPIRARSLVTWAWHGGPLVRPEDFPGLAAPEPAPSRPIGGRCRMPPGHHSQSERDWAAAGDALRRGEDPETVISRLEQRRQDKPDPGYYARRTVRRKQEELKRGFSR